MLLILNKSKQRDDFRMDSVQGLALLPKLQKVLMRVFAFFPGVNVPAKVLFSQACHIIDSYFFLMDTSVIFHPFKGNGVFFYRAD